MSTMTWCQSALAEAKMLELKQCTQRLRNVAQYKYEKTRYAEHAHTRMYRHRCVQNAIKTTQQKM